MKRPDILGSIGQQDVLATIGVVVVACVAAAARPNTSFAQGEQPPVSTADAPADTGETDVLAAPDSGKTAIIHRCVGRVATIVGNNKNNRLIGTKGDDVIVGLGGNDYIDGRGGNDVICGGNGDDKLLGGTGKDRLYGNKGNDKLEGGSGNDRLSGHGGVDLLLGGSGNDLLLGGDQGDELRGGPGSNTLRGGANGDWCREGRTQSCESGSRGTVRAKGSSARVGSGALHTFSVAVEEGVAEDVDDVAEFIEETLGDSRGWTKGGRHAFKRVPNNGAIKITLATPGRVDAVCAQAGLATGGKVSCNSTGRRVMLNLDRWRYSVKHWKGPVKTYRQMLVNHEVGHAIGQGHRFCSGKGKKAPVMQQQTKFLMGCVENSWPLDSESGARRKIGNIATTFTFKPTAGKHTRVHELLYAE